MTTPNQPAVTPSREARDDARDTWRMIANPAKTTQESRDELQLRLILAFHWSRVGPELLEALEAEERASAFCVSVSESHPDGQKIHWNVQNDVSATCKHAANLRRRAISEAKGEGR